MSPETLRLIVESSIRKAVILPWWSYMFAFLLPIFGAYLGAYVKKKAEDRASQENFERLLDQLRKTTEETEAIKIALSKKNWLTQQQWVLREKHYTGLLSHLTKLKLSLEDRKLYYVEPGSEHNETISQDENFLALSKTGQESYQAIRELIGPASLFLSQDAIKSLEYLVRNDLDNSLYSACMEEYVSEALKLVERAQSIILKEARDELLSHTCT